MSLKLNTPSVSTRFSWDEHWMAMAASASLRSGCPRRKVGAVLVSAENQLLGTGYNALPQPCGIQCVERPIELRCAGHDAPSGTALNLCGAMHAEQNALRYADRNKIATAYVTTFPCFACTKELLNTTCTRIVYGEQYTSTEGYDYWHSQMVVNKEGNKTKLERKSTFLDARKVVNNLKELYNRPHRMEIDLPVGMRYKTYQDVSHLVTMSCSKSPPKELVVQWMLGDTKPLYDFMRGAAISTNTNAAIKKLEGWTWENI